MLPKTRRETRGWWRLVSRSLDMLYPPECAVCGDALSYGRALCDGCDADLPRLAEPFCETCGEPFQGRIDGSFSCPNCRGLKFSFEFSRPAMVRDERTLEMIHRLKYAREVHLAKDLGRLAAEAFADPRLAPALAGKWPLVPVPLHRGRLQHRYFNQAEEITREISDITGLPMVRALCRIRATDHQTSLTRAERLANLRGAFQLTRHAGNPPGVVLVDDVLTTGSTMEECAKTLRRGGIPRVCTVTVMRG